MKKVEIRGEEVETEFGCCPRCESDAVEWTNSRDLDVLTSYVHCVDCGLNTFHVETSAFTSLPNMDYKTSLMKYNSWIKTNPKLWHEDEWD